MDGPIGIFDSGVGGLTVLKEVIKILPYEDIIYLGDTARVPYGIRSHETILKYSYANADFLMTQKIKLLVIACNTASSVSTRYLKKRFNIPIIEVITPGAKRAAKATKNQNIGVIGTEAMIRSENYVRAIKELNPLIEVYPKACPLFVPLVEEGWTEEDNEVSLMVAKKYLNELILSNIDTLVLGCTHYPLLKSVIKKVMGYDVKLVDSAQETAKEILRILKERKLLSSDQGKGNVKFFVTDDIERFKKIGYKFLGIKIKTVQKIETIA
jgi:glutamate racemase